MEIRQRMDKVLKLELTRQLIPERWADNSKLLCWTMEVWVVGTTRSCFSTEIRNLRQGWKKGEETLSCSFLSKIRWRAVCKAITCNQWYFKLNAFSHR